MEQSFPFSWLADIKCLPSPLLCINSSDSRAQIVSLYVDLHGSREVCLFALYLGFISLVVVNKSDLNRSWIIFYFMFFCQSNIMGKFTFLRLILFCSRQSIYITINCSLHTFNKKMFYNYYNFPLLNSMLFDIFALRASALYKLQFISMESETCVCIHVKSQNII